MDRPEPELLQQIIVELRAHGERAVQFLHTAGDLVDAGVDRSLRSPEVVAYCLREALTTITASQDRGDGGAWRNLSRLVVDARRRYRIASEGLPGQDPEAELANLLRAVDDLERFHQSEDVHQRRLIAVIVDRTGAMPYESGTKLVNEYSKVLKRLNNSLHSGVDADVVIDLYDQSVGLLRRLFTPPEARNAELEALAGIVAPTSDDVTRLRQLVVSPQHLQHFLGHLRSPAWLGVLSDSTFIDPPTGESSWPGFAAVKALSSSHPEELAAWLTALYGRCGDDPGCAWQLGLAALDSGAAAHALVVRAARDHRTSSGLQGLAYSLLANTEPAEPIVDELADVLLSPDNADKWMIAQIGRRLADGVTAENGTPRLKLVGHRLRQVDQNQRRWRSFTMDPSGSIAARSGPMHEDRFDLLVGAFVAVAEAVRPIGGIRPVLKVADDLPTELRARVRSWILGIDPDVPIADLVAEIAHGIGERGPTGDDLPLIDRVTETCEVEVYRDAWTEALGPAPTIEEAGRAIGAQQPDPSWQRTHRWLGLLPETVRGPWGHVFALMSAAYGTPRRSYLDSQPRIEAMWGRSPMSVEELGEMEPVDAAEEIAAWRADPSQFLVGARELARTVESAVQAEPARWLAEPIETATKLREPVYISHYLSGAAKVLADVPGLAIGELIDVVTIVRSHAWEPVVLGRDDVDYDPDWRQAEAAAVEVLRSLADKDLGFANRDDEAWEVIQTAVLDRTDGSGLLDEAEPLASAINRPCTKALEAAVSFMAYEYRSHEATRPATFELIEGTLRLEGFEGAQHRAILASRFGFFTTTAADWVDANAELLFGADAPDGLGQLTVDLALHWTQPNRWLLQRFRGAVRDAVVREVENALDQVLVANLWEIPGYSTDEVVSFFVSKPGLLSRAGEALGRLASHTDEADHLAVAVRIWQAALDNDTRESRRGFGWFTEVKGIDDELWASLTLRTLHTSGGVIDWAHAVAERVQTMTPSITTLAILDELVRHAEADWDRRRSVEIAVEHLAAATTHGDTMEFQRLRTTLLERGLL